MVWKIRLHQDKHKNYAGIPFKIPSKTMETWGCQEFSRKDEFLAKRRPFYKICSKDDLSSKYCNFVDFLGSDGTITIQSIT